MGNLNYFTGTVKLLESPYFLSSKRQTTKLTFRVELSQSRKNRIINLRVWGKLASIVKNCYKKNDYILIEGYISNRLRTNLPLGSRNLKRITITIVKVYPILLNLNNHRNIN